MAAESNSSIQEMQQLEQILQQFIMQKQATQLEHNEVLNALTEVKKTSGDVYKMLEGIMLKSDKDTVIKDLEERKKMLDVRLKAIEKQEQSLIEKADKLRKK